MAEYLDREAAVKAFNNFDAGRADDPPFTLLTPEEFAEYLYELPTADVAPVVRCKDCKYGEYDSKPDGAMVCLRTKDGFWRKETDFCSYGERMQQAKREKAQRKYGEILALYRYCVEVGMDARLERLHDGWAVRFPNGGDFAQHAGTYGTHDGFVEPAIGCEQDYSPVSLREAEKLICENRGRLMTPSCEEEQ